MTFRHALHTAVRIASRPAKLSPPRIVTVNTDIRQDHFETLRLGSVLQSTLEISELIALLCKELETKVEFSSLRYSSAPDHLIYEFGTTAKYAINYRLVILQESLGELELTRDAQFETHDLLQIENFLTALIYPLRNALLYRRALTNALTDPVTNIHNRSAFNTTLKRELQLAQRHHHDLSLIMVDADHFKRVNDNYGHVIGDRVLRALAERLSSCIRTSDMVFRYGGEEFAIVLSNTNLDGARTLAHKIRSRVQEDPFDCESLKLPATVSLGVGCCHRNDTLTTFLERTDKALYLAKDLGRNRVVTEAEMTEHLTRS